MRDFNDDCIINKNMKHYLATESITKEIQVKSPSHRFEGFYLKKKKQFLPCCFIANKNKIKFHLSTLRNTFINLTRRYDIMIVMDDFKVGSNEANMQHFLNLCNLKNLITEKSCFENRENPSYNDLINCSKSFQDSDTHETRLPGFNQMTVSVLKMHFPKQKSSFILYCDYKSVSNEIFIADLWNELSKYDMYNKECQHFLITFTEVQEKQENIRKKYVRANKSYFTNKILGKAMRRSSLCNLFLKERTKKTEEI